MAPANPARKGKGKGKEEMGGATDRVDPIEETALRRETMRGCELAKLTFTRAVRLMRGRGDPGMARHDVKLMFKHMRGDDCDGG